MKVKIQWHTAGVPGYKRVPIDADVVSKCGRFAIHKAPERDWLNGWKLSHLPTGCFILATNTKRDAIKAMREIEAINGPWSSRSRKRIQQDMADLVRPIVMRYDRRYAGLTRISA